MITRVCPDKFSDDGAHIYDVKVCGLPMLQGIGQVLPPPVTFYMRGFIGGSEETQRETYIYIYICMYSPPQVDRIWGIWGSY